MILLCRTEIPNYIKEVEISKAPRTQYYNKKDRIPKKYSSSKYGFKKNFLVSLDTFERVIKRQSTGKPKFHSIRGQEIWRGINYHLRSKIASEMKKYFYEHTIEIPQLLDEMIYPLSIRIDFYDNINEGEDLDNMVYLYRKTLHDSLCGNVVFDKVQVPTVKGKKPVYQMIPNRDLYPPKLIDDDKYHIQDIPTRFYPLKDGEERKMVIEICSLKDEE